MPDPISHARIVTGMGNPFPTVPRSPSWDRAGASHEPRDPPLDVIHEAIRAAHEELADAMLHGSEGEIEDAEERLERYQRVADRRSSKEYDHPDEVLVDPIDDGSDVVWLDDAEDDHDAA